MEYPKLGGFPIAAIVPGMTSLLKQINITHGTWFARGLASAFQSIPFRKDH